MKVGDGEQTMVGKINGAPGVEHYAQKKFE
jgi:hypothetical protein